MLGLFQSRFQRIALGIPDSTAGNWYISGDMNSQQEDYGLRPGYGAFHLPSSPGHRNDTQANHVPLPQGFIFMEQSFFGQLDSRNDPLRMLDPQSSPVQSSGSGAFVSSCWGSAVNHSAAYPDFVTSQQCLPESHPVERASQWQAPGQWLQRPTFPTYTTNAGPINSSETPNMDISCLITEAFGQAPQSPEKLYFQNQQLPNSIIPYVRAGNSEMPRQAMLSQNEFNSRNLPGNNPATGCSFLLFTVIHPWRPCGAGC